MGQTYQKNPREINRYRQKRGGGGTLHVSPTRSLVSGISESEEAQTHQAIEVPIGADVAETATSVEQNGQRSADETVGGGPEKRQILPTKDKSARTRTRTNRNTRTRETRRRPTTH